MGVMCNFFSVTVKFELSLRQREREVTLGVDGCGHGWDPKIK